MAATSGQEYFEYKRWIRDVKITGKVFCNVCNKTDQSFSKNGLRQHVSAKHKLANKDLILKQSEDFTQGLAVKECLDMLTELSFHEKDTNEYASEKTVRVNPSDAGHKFYSSSHKAACWMLLTLLDEQGNVKSHPNPPIKVTVQDCVATIKYDCWKADDGFKTIVTFYQQNQITSQLTNINVQHADLQSASSIEDPLLETLNKVFGFQSFRRGQRDIVLNILSGQDGIVLVPTGGGKTLCFTMPALLTDGITVVVTPTISLAQDLYLRTKEICPCINFSASDSDRDMELINLETSAVKIILTTPEILQNHDVRKTLEKCKVSRLVIDESHCISSWGLAFRPAYLKLGELKNIFKCQCIAFSATATMKTVDVIEKMLNLTNPFKIIHSFLRENLHLTIKEKLSPKQCCGDILAMLKTSLKDQSVIIYCNTPTEVEKVYVYLRENNIICVTYHGGLSPFTKNTNLLQWKSDRAFVIIATKSLGMGIDKANVKSVIHYSVPDSIPEYYQQVGRSGRNGKTAGCFLYFSFGDRVVHIKHIEDMADKSQAKIAFDEWKAMVALCVANECIMYKLLAYFGELPPKEKCNMCSFCVNGANKQCVDISVYAKHTLLLLQGLITKIGKVSFTVLSKVLIGSKEKYILTKNLNMLPLYGCCKMSLTLVQKMLVLLITKEILVEENGSMFPGLQSERVHNPEFQLKLYH